MGNYCSMKQPLLLDKDELRAQMEVNRAIEEEIERDRNTKILKLLLLGPGESGKSTTIKQIKIIHDSGFSIEERILRKYGIYLNVLEGLEEINRSVHKNNLTYGNSLSTSYIEQIMNYAEIFKRAHEMQLPKNINDLIIKYVEDTTIQDILDKKTVYNIDDSVVYFLKNFDRLCDKEYVPTQEDILKNRVPTSGVVQFSLVLKNFNFRIYDVGGQRAERRKWIHVFDDVHTILFITSLAEYDQVLREDITVNRMKESLNLFDKIINGRYFANTPSILFLNKIDLFTIKIKHVNINVALTSYSGPQEKEDALKYIRNRFLYLNKSKKRTVYTHVTCATDTKQIEVVIDSVIDVVIQNTMKKVGIQ